LCGILSGISIPKHVETRNCIGARPLRKQQRNCRYFMVDPAAAYLSPLLSHIVVTAHIQFITLAMVQYSQLRTATLRSVFAGAYVVSCCIIVPRCYRVSYLLGVLLAVSGRRPVRRDGIFRYSLNTRFGMFDGDILRPLLTSSVWRD
jgi:hypothetical protein